MPRKLKTPGCILHASTLANEAKLPPARVREIFTYDPNTGVLKWRETAGNRAAGTVAGRVQNHGYWRVGVARTNYAVHRIAWCLTYGEWPPAILDHINCVHGDNRIANLRLATPSQNNANMRSWHRDPRHLRGTRLTKKGRWQAMISKDYKQHNLGLYDTAEEAHAAYAAMARLLYGDFARIQAL